VSLFKSCLHRCAGDSRCQRHSQSRSMISNNP
jgi:hypothetical protein